MDTKHLQHMVGLPLAGAALLITCTMPFEAAAGVAPTVHHASTAHPGEEHPGASVSLEPVATLSADEARATLRDGGWPDTSVRHGVRAYRVTYGTTDAAGRPVRATGLLAVPATSDRRLTRVVYAHGTTTYRGDVASTWTDSYDDAPAVAIAGAGYAALLPDYVGLGGGQGRPAWMHVGSETAAIHDLVTASRHALATLHRTATPTTHLIGFSQGASAVLGYAQATNPSRVGRVFAISGAHDAAGTELPALLDGDVPEPLAVAYASLLLVSWDQIWPIYDHPAEVFKAPYDRRVPPLFDGGTPATRCSPNCPVRSTSCSPRTAGRSSSTPREA